MRIAALLLWCIILTPSFAALPPKGCITLPVKGEAPAFSAKKSQVLILQNKGNNTLWVTHPPKNAGASAGWTSEIKPKQWSALVLDQKDFVLNCIESQPGHEQQIACEGVLSVCLWKKAKVPTNETGTFWAVENSGLEKLKASLSERGFKLPNK